MYTVYAIFNRTSGSIYIGQTEDIDRRLVEHNSHTFRGYTARFDGEWQLIYTEVVGTRQEALKREKQLKSFRGREFIKSHIRE